MSLMSKFTLSLCLSLPDSVTLEQALAQTPFVPPSGIMSFSQGWFPISKRGQEPVFYSEPVEGLNATRFLFKYGSKKIPSAVLKEALEAKIARVEEAEGRNVGKKERAQIKEMVRDELLQVTPPSISTAHVLLLRDPFQAASANESMTLLFIEGNHKMQEQVFSQLISDLRDKIALQVWMPKQSLRSAMTGWVQDQSSVPPPFGIGGQCRIQGNGSEAPVSTFSNEDLSCSFVQEQLNEGRVVESLEMFFRLPDSRRDREMLIPGEDWDARFTLASDGSISRFANISFDCAAVSDTLGDAADFYINGVLMRELAESLTEELGGLA